MSSQRRVALALGSGGARGYAHIGVIQVLEERGCEIVAVAGSSMGALVGGVHAAGKLPQYVDWATSLRQLDVVRLLDVSLSSPGAIRAEKVLAKVRETLGDLKIENLDIPYTSVATDLLSGREVWFQKGPIDVAIRASIAIPGVITPVVLNGRLLADGGVLNPVPIAPLAVAQADMVVAVSLAGEDTNQPDPGPPVEETAEARPVEEWTDRFRASASQLLDRDLVRSVLSRFGGGKANPFDEEAILRAGEVPEPADVDEVLDDLASAEAIPAGLGKFEMMNRSLETMQSVLIRHRLAAYPPDVLISVPRDACRIVDFHRAAEMIALGRKLAEDALDAYGVAAPDDVPKSPSDAGSGPVADAVQDSSST